MKMGFAGTVNPNKSALYEKTRKIQNFFWIFPFSIAKVKKMC